MSGPSLEQMMAQMSSISGTGGPETFTHHYKAAKEWEEAKKRGDEKALKKLDFGVGPLCQVKDWKQSRVARAQPHKELCALNKVRLFRRTIVMSSIPFDLQEYMKRIPYFRAETTQFPWMRIETDGTCNHDVIKARLKVLGSGPSFGYWSIPGGLRPHDHNPSMLPGMLPTRKGKLAPYRRGATKAWKSEKDELVPKLFFDGDVPARPQPGQIKDWKSWYEWRGLPLESPAALLMDFPLTAYYLLNDVLKLVDQSEGSGKRRLLVHYIGAEVELNFLPLFSELALLLPDTHIDLVIYGKAAYDLVQMACKDFPQSIATRDIVWSYTAPKKTGGGSIEIRLAGDSDTWSRHDIIDKRKRPDALLGLNAGLLSYTTWSEPMQFSHILSIPFAVTDYAEQTMYTTVNSDSLPRMFASMAAQFRAFPEYAAVANKQRTHPVTVNPFHRPGQRGLPVVRMPNYYNGFAMPVVMKD
ncbi:hypothetical protein EWM64_g9515 [Hericium alpestre]|uniref:Mitochondrial splicing suppressor 51-like C-terminal domain-containing protein n=1 Tax=Hericium alpestre TaxID=135208 RepID=A0A4Y9ZKE4_9AGAM|nr:hypothetical protein EWM64_g9515 [Hericium alpestre]